MDEITKSVPLEESFMTMPYVEFAWRDSKYDQNVPLHYHSYSEMIFFESKEPMEYLIGTERFLLKRGDILCIPRNVQHQPLPAIDRKESYKRYILWVNDDFWEQVFAMFPDPRFVSGLPTSHLRTGNTPWETIFRDLMEKGLQESRRREPGWHMAIANTAIQFSVQQERAFLDKNMQTLEALQLDLVDQVIGYVEDNLCAPLDLTTLAGQFHVSKSTISHAFRGRMGISAHQYITQRRLTEAEKLLKSDVPFDEIKERVGFADYTTFFKAFKQRYGVSPRDFKKEKKQI